MKLETLLQSTSLQIEQNQKQKSHQSTTTPTNQAVILTIKTSEPVTMLTENKALEQIDNQTWTFKKSINGTITFKFTDAAGNVGTAKYTVENIDKVKPTISGVDNKGEYNENKNVTFEDDKTWC